jgi:hypothetical protein
MFAETLANCTLNLINIGNMLPFKKIRDYVYKQFIAIEIWGRLAKSHAVCKFSQSLDLTKK